MSFRFLVGALLVVVGCSGVTDASVTASIALVDGIVTVEGTVNGNREHCQGPHPFFSDIRAGMEVVVRDARGAVVGTGQLDAGEPYLDHRSGTQDVYYCRLPFNVGLTRYVDAYDFSFGERAGPSYTHSELEDLSWRIAVAVR